MNDANPDDAFARWLRGFGPVGIIAILVILLVGNDWIFPLAGLLVLAWAWRSRTPWHELGLVRPKNWFATAAIGITLGILLKFLMKAVVMPLFGADPVNRPYHYLAGNTAALPAAIWTMIVSAGFGEEMVFRGFLFERLGKILGTSRAAKTSIVIIAAALFAAGHYANQGIPGVQQAAVMGLVYGGIFAGTGQLLVVMFMHAAFNLTALAIIYFDFEYTVAHLIFE